MNITVEQLLQAIRKDPTSSLMALFSSFSLGEEQLIEPEPLLLRPPPPPPLDIPVLDKVVQEDKVRVCKLFQNDPEVSKYLGVCYEEIRSSLKLCDTFRRRVPHRELSILTATAQTVNQHIRRLRQTYNVQDTELDVVAEALGAWVKELKRRQSQGPQPG